MNKTKLTPLTPQEESVMQIIWELGDGVAIRQILDKMPEPKPPYTTLASIVKNLHTKEYIQPEKSGKTMLYKIEVTQEQLRLLSPAHRTKLLWRRLQASSAIFCTQREYLAPGSQRDNRLD